MRQYEYLFYRPTEQYGNSVWKLAELNDLGRDGWEAVCPIPHGILLKRPIEDTQSATPREESNHE